MKKETFYQKRIRNKRFISEIVEISKANRFARRDRFKRQSAVGTHISHEAQIYFSIILKPSIFSRKVLERESFFLKRRECFNTFRERDHVK